MGSKKCFPFKMNIWLSIFFYFHLIKMKHFCPVIEELWKSFSRHNSSSELLALPPPDRQVALWRTPRRRSRKPRSRRSVPFLHAFPTYEPKPCLIPHASLKGECLLCRRRRSACGRGWWRRCSLPPWVTDDDPRAAAGVCDGSLVCCLPHRHAAEGNTCTTTTMH